MCIINLLCHLAKISEFSMLLFIYSESLESRDLSTLRSNLESYYSKQRPWQTVHCSAGEINEPWLFTIYEVR